MALRETPGDFARLYKLHGLEGGHLIKLGPGNDEAAKDALRAWPGPLWFCPHRVASHECIKRSGGLQIGGGINDKNALSWIECGASKVNPFISNLHNKQCSSVQVIVTSYLFPETKFSLQRLQTISSLVGKERLVVDIRCVCWPVSH